MRMMISIVGLVGVPICLYLNVDPTLLIIFAGLLYVPVWISEDNPRPLARADYIRRLEREVGIEPWGDDDPEPWVHRSPMRYNTGKPQSY